MQPDAEPSAEGVSSALGHLPVRTPSFNPTGTEPPDGPVPVEVMGWTTTSGNETDESAPGGW